MGFDEGRVRWWPALAGTVCLWGLVAGCASPGTPRAPSLQEPEVVRDLTVLRVGDGVQVGFTVPTRTSDGVAIRSATVGGVLCRQEEKAGPCRVVNGDEGKAPLLVGEPVRWRDVLPPELATGPARAVAYRVELRNAAGKSAGYSEAAYAVAGGTPPAVEGFLAVGMRSGVLLKWHAASGPAEVLVRRERLDPATAVRGRSPKPEGATATKRQGKGVAKSPRGDADREDAVVWLKAPAGGPGVPEMVDGTIEEGVRYRYSALRAETVRVGGRTMEVRSAPSAEVVLAWKDIYPPAAPQGLTVLGYAGGSGQGDAEGYAVDLVWEPVNDPRVTGYVVRRQRLGASGQPAGVEEKLTVEPVSTPGFHDATAIAGERYRYQVMAEDAKGNVSAPATAETH